MRGQGAALTDRTPSRGAQTPAARCCASFWSTQSQPPISFVRRRSGNLDPTTAQAPSGRNDREFGPSRTERSSQRTSNRTNSGTRESPNGGRGLRAQISRLRGKAELASDANAERLLSNGSLERLRASCSGSEARLSRSERAPQIISRIRSLMIVRAIFSASGVPRASEVELG